MPGRIPPSLLGKAQRMLAPPVLAAVQANPNARLPKEIWQGLSEEQRQFVATLRKGLSDFRNPAAEGAVNLTAGQPRWEAPVTRSNLYEGTAAENDGPPPRLPGDEGARAILAQNPPPEMDVRAYKNVQGQALRNALRSVQGPGRVLDYGSMRSEAYTYVFNRSGRLLDYYTGQQKRAEASPDPSQYNWEHIFAQSWNGLKGTMWRSHTFNGVPTHDRENGMRGHLPFGEVRNVDQQSGFVKIGSDQSGRTVAELDPAVRGDIALRALWMYCEAPEHLPADAEFMLPTMVKWLVDDPPDTVDLEVVGRAEQVEEETLYFAHCPRDLVLRAFVDILGKYQEQSPDIKALFNEAEALVARDQAESRA